MSEILAKKSIARLEPIRVVESAGKSRKNLLTRKDLYAANCCMAYFFEAISDIRGVTTKPDTTKNASTPRYPLGKEFLNV
jgi:hypothetical protein